MSYIALDKFRYYLKAIKIITKARSNALDVIDKDEDEDEDEDEVKVVDSSITTLNRKLLNVKKDGICAELGYPYGTEKKTGWANNAVVLLLIVQYIIFSIIVHLGDELDGCIFYFMFFIALVGTILPAFLIYNGNRTLNKIEKETDEIVDDVQRTHGYKRSIDSSISLKFENNQDG